MIDVDYVFVWWCGDVVYVVIDFDCVDDFMFVWWIVGDVDFGDFIVECVVDVEVLFGGGVVYEGGY